MSEASEEAKISEIQSPDENVEDKGDTIENIKARDGNDSGNEDESGDEGSDGDEGGDDDNDVDDDDEDDDEDDEEDDDEEEDGDNQDDDEDADDDEDEKVQKASSSSNLGKRSIDDLLDDDASKMDSPSAKVDDKSKKNKKRKKKDKSKKSSKRRKTDVGRLFNDMAEEGDDDDEEDYDVRETGEVVTTKDELDAIKRQEEGRKRLKDMFGGTAEEIARRYEELSEVQEIEESRYQAMDQYYAQNTQVAQQSLLPSAKDPKIFMIKCTPGKEQSLVMSIMNKTIDVYEKAKIMKVKSAFCGSARGFVFVESLSDTLVREIILGLKGLYSNKVRQLAVTDMTSALKVKILTKPIQVGDFVRIKRGPMKGDLVRILVLKEGDTKAEIQAVPRIDYEEERQALSGDNSLKVNAGKKVRPMPQLFNVELAFSISDTDVDRDKQSGFYQWRGNTYKDGFLIKTVDVNGYINSTNVNPTLEELKFFTSALVAQQQEENNDAVALGNANLYRPAVDINKQLKTLMSAMEGVQAVPYVPGDIIQVLSGEMAGLIGRILDVYEMRKILRIESISPKLPLPVEIEENLVCKYVELGAHVKIMGGQFVGHTGRVVAMTMNEGDPVAVVVSDGSKSEMYCNVSLLQVSNEVAHGRGALGGYQKDDLVQLNENEVGMIIDVGLEALRIITQLEIVKDIHPNEIRMKMNTISQRTKLFDAEQKQFGVGDMLRVVSGNHEKSSGAVRHVYKGTVWLHSDMYFKNSGIMVVKPRFCLLIGSLHTGRPPSTLASAAPLKANGSGSGNSNMASTPNSITSRQSGGTFNANGNNNNSNNKGGGRFARDPLIGKTVRIVKGQYRGLSAQVVNGSGGFYQVELLAKMKKVTIPASTFLEEGDERGRIKAAVSGGDNSTHSQYSGMQDSFGMGNATPYVGMQTPAYTGSETPRILSGNEGSFSVVNSSSSSSGGSSSSMAMFTPRRPVDADNDSAMDLDIGDYGTPQHLPAASRSTNNNSSTAENTTTSTSTSTSKVVGAAAAVNTDPSTWVENMVVLLKNAEYMGRLAVLKQLPNHEQKVVVQQRDGAGMLIGPDITLAVSAVSPPERPSVGAAVKMLAGKHAGVIGKVKMVIKGMVMVTGEGDLKENCPLNSLLWLNSAP